jgi:hypothetical protein
MAESKGRSISWSTRILIVGAVLILISGFLLTSQSDTIYDIYDPRKAAIATIESEGQDASQLIELEKDHCYIAYHLVGSGGMEVTITPVDGSATDGEAIEPSSCFSDWVVMTSDGSEFEECEDCRWVSGFSGEAIVSSQCNEDSCQDAEVWLIHINEVEYKVFESIELLVGMGICCLGIMLLPIAGIVAYSNRANNIQGTVLMVGPDGTTQSFSSSEEMMESMNNQATLQGGPVGSPFAETGVSDDPDFVDGSADVMQGKLLTTEQVYSLMRGDVEEAVNAVDDPFADTQSRPRREAPKREVNTEQISSWDAGISETAPKKKTQTMTKKAPASVVIPSDSKHWKDWDEK